MIRENRKQQINESIKKRISINDSIVIYPFGEYGKYAKKALNKLGVEEKYICDKYENPKPGEGGGEEVLQDRRL